MVETQCSLNYTKGFGLSRMVVRSSGFVIYGIVLGTIICGPRKTQIVDESECELINDYFMLGLIIFLIC